MEGKMKKVMPKTSEFLLDLLCFAPFIIVILVVLLD
jgi:hypothetical protein